MEMDCDPVEADAVIVQLPALIPVTKPLFTVHTFTFELFHVTVIELGVDKAKELPMGINGIISNDGAVVGVVVVVGMATVTLTTVIEFVL